MGNWLAAVGNATPTLTKTWQTIQEEKRLQQKTTEESAIRAESLGKLRRERGWEEGNVQVMPGQEGQPVMGPPAESPANFAQSPYDVPGTTAPQQAISPEGVAKQQQQVEAQKKKDAFMQEPVPVAAHPGYMQFSTNPDAQKAIIDGLVAQGAIDPRTGAGPRWKIQKALETMAKNEDFVNKTLVNTGKMYITQANDISEKISKLEEDQEHLTANGPKIADLKKQRDGFIAKATPLLASANDLFKAQKDIQGMSAQIDAMKKSGEWDKIPLPIRNAFETAANTGHADMWKSAQDKWIAMKTQKWEPTNKEEALEVAAARHAGQGWKPQSMEEALVVRMAGQTPKKTDEEKLIYERKKAEMLADVKAKDIDISSIANAVGEGQDARIAVKGSMGNPVASKVQSVVLQKYPKFNFEMSDANYKWKQSATNQRTINFVGGSLPRISMLVQQVDAMKNTTIPAINKVMRQISIQTGRPEYTNFEANRNAIVQEVNTALSGSSTPSDMRIKIELENLQSARSPVQIKGAIHNLNEALMARLDVDLSPIYPLEVVQGKKTVEQYKKELRTKYSKNFTSLTTATEGETGTLMEKVINGKTYIQKNGKWYEK